MRMFVDTAKPIYYLPCCTAIVKLHFVRLFLEDYIDRLISENSQFAHCTGGDGASELSGRGESAYRGMMEANKVDPG